MFKRNILVVTVLVLVFAFAIGSIFYPLFNRDRMQLGLDLQGGLHMVYQGGIASSLGDCSLRRIVGIVDV